MCQAFSSLADIGGDSEIEEMEGDVQVYYDDVMPLSVNDDLSDYVSLPPIYVTTSDMYPSRQYGNVINSLSGNADVDFIFNPYILNNTGKYGGYDLIYVLTFSNGYDPSAIGVKSSSDSITGNIGFKFSIMGATLSGSSSYLPTCKGFQYVDDNTIRISYSRVESGTFSDLVGFRLSANSYLKDNTIKCQLYMRKNNTQVSMEGGDGGGGSEGGGGAAT